MVLFKRKIAREKKTIKTMIELFCSHKHDSKKVLCASCGTLLEYANLRLEKCPFGEEKTACADCAVHCYQPARRKEIIEVMRYSGPRMALRYPLLVISHLMKPK